MASESDQIAQSYIDHPEKQKQLYKRTLIIVVISQMFGGAGLAAGVTVGALLAEEMLGTNAFAGIPSALFTLGAAGTAFMVGRLSNSFGRRIGLATGFMAGGLGAVGVVVAALLNSVFLLFLSLFIYGAGTATNLQARYAGTDLATNKQRGTAVSIAMVSTTLGAVAGPNLVEVMGNVASSIHVPELAGPFILAAAAYLLAGLVLFVLLRPDPFLIALKINANQQKTAPEEVPEKKQSNRKGIIAGSIIMVVSQMVMGSIMAMTPIHMEDYHQSLSAIGLVIGFHIGFMYFPSLFTGVLVDKLGRVSMAVAAGVVLFLAGVMAALVPGDSVFLMVVALSLLGIGWNMGLISGTTLVVDSTETSTRAKTQGTVDVFMRLGGASSSALSGLIVAGFGFQMLSMIGAASAIVLIVIVVWFHHDSKKQVQANPHQI